ncbi:DUF6985 domain-containing protein [Rubinisphaera sp. JC750]|uniref:DUF6985 domain-containing protein n=1 Tax=Rubinisphaera sp. JC750 TaxID=2898658 RepID=UPI001F2C96E5|nr:hypothetical protein [Rubinisphaera sp. JC750]
MSDTPFFDETGPLTYDPDRDEHSSSPIAIPLLDLDDAVIVIEGYLDDPCPADFRDAIQNFFRCERSTLLRSSDDLFRYYTDVKSLVDDDDIPAITKPEGAWDHIQFGREVCFVRRIGGDNRIYATIECGCDWEREHGLQIVLRDGHSVCKLGPYDGHLTNADAFADPSLEDVVYREFG